MQFDAVNPLCLRLGVVNMTHETETCAPHLSNLNLITRLQRPTFGHLIGGSGYPMSVDLIVLGNELTAIYFPLSHDTLSVVGSDGAGSRPEGFLRPYAASATAAPSQVQLYQRTQHLSNHLLD
jgi:hypothetical protein